MGRCSCNYSIADTAADSIGIRNIAVGTGRQGNNISLDYHNNLDRNLGPDPGSMGSPDIDTDIEH